MTRSLVPSVAVPSLLEAARAVTKGDVAFLYGRRAAAAAARRRYYIRVVHSAERSAA
jgi:hypothetical protein